MPGYRHGSPLLRSRVLLLAWAVALVGLAVFAGIRRHSNHLGLRKSVADALTPAAHGSMGTSDYLWAWNMNFNGSPQGQAIYLLENGYADAEFERLLLLCEAQRFHPWRYLSDSVGNDDLRRGLVADCLGDFPNDFPVRWAAGVIQLGSGRDHEAAEHFATLMQQCGSYEGLVDKVWLVNSPAEHITGRYATALTLCGREAEAHSLLADIVKRMPQDPGARSSYQRYLLETGKLEELISQVEKLGNTDEYSSYDRVALLREAYFWSGQREQFMALESNYADEMVLPYRDEWDDAGEEEIAIRTYRARSYLWQRGPDTAVVALEAATSYSALYPEYLGPYDPSTLHADDFADLAGATGDPGWLRQLQAAWKGVLALRPPEHEAHAHNVWSAEQARSGLALWRGYVLLGDWVSAAAMMEAIAPSEGWEVDAPREETLRLLTRLALGLPLEPKPATGTAPPEQADPWAPDQRGGPYADLREGDLLTAVLRSRQFRDALASSGRPPAEVYAEVREATRPHRGKYFDSSNGILDGWRP